MIYQLYLKQVEAWKERFVFTSEFDARIYNRHTGSIATTEDLLLSRHKDTIELLEAIIKEVEGMKVEIDETRVNKRGHHTNGVHRQIRHNKALDGVLTKLKSEIELIKKS